jgi:hypothetical protein
MFVITYETRELYSVTNGVARLDVNIILFGVKRKAINIH